MANEIQALKYTLQVLWDIDIAFIVVATIPTILRFYVRGVLTKAFSGDDWAMVACYVFYIITSIMAFIFDKELKDVFVTGKIPTNLGMFLKINAGFYTLSMIFLKISLGLFFLKIFTLKNQWQRYVIHAIIWISTAYGLVNFGMTIGTCGAISRFGASQCTMANVYSQVSISWSALNAITDFILAALTVQAIWKASLPLGTKLSASAVLVLGCLGGVATIVRLVIITRPSSSTASALSAAYWTLIEASVGIAAASLATLRPLFRSCMEHVNTSKGSGYNNTYGPQATSHLRSRVHANTLHDWREDRIPMNELEKGMSANVIQASTTILIQEERLGDAQSDESKLLS